MTFSRDDPRPRLTIRFDEETDEQIDRLAEDRDLSKSALVRAAVDEYLTDNSPHEPPEQTPSDPTLRDVYLWMDKRATSDGKIPSSCIGDIAQYLGVDKTYVKRGVLDDLQENGWIDGNFSHITLTTPQ